MSQTLTYDLNSTSLKEGSHTLYARGLYSTEKSSSVSWTSPSYGGLTFSALTSGSSVTLGIGKGNPQWDGYYSLNMGATWIPYIPGSTGAIVLNSIGDKVCFKGDYTCDVDAHNYLKFSMTGSIGASGNIMSLCNGDNYSNVLEIPSGYCFYYLFSDCSSLVTAPTLPATSLKMVCYANMFRGSGVVTAPSLPATKLTDSCYYGMFTNCSSLETASELPATSISGSSAYQNMFMNCTSLVTPPSSLPFIDSYDMYESMFSGCTSLTTAPILSTSSFSISTGWGQCDSMFKGCSSLKVNDTGTGTLFFVAPTCSSSFIGAYNYMFTGTGGTFTGTPVANGYYYYS